MAHEHHHHHHHHHGHGGGDDPVGEHNKAFFDEMATAFAEVPWIQDVGKQVSGELQSNAEWIGIQGSSKKGKMLDYACGTGVVARALALYMETVLGVDISAGMVGEFNRLAEAEGHSSARIRAIHGDLLNPRDTPAPALDAPDAWEFDLVAMGLALHHVSDVETMLARLAERLRPGGTLLIIDLVAAERSSLPDAGHIPHKGFTEDQLRGLFAKLGLQGWGWKLFSAPTEIPAEHGGRQQAFMARGVRAANEHEL